MHLFISEGGGWNRANTKPVFEGTVIFLIVRHDVYLYNFYLLARIFALIYFFIRSLQQYRQGLFLFFKERQ